MTIEKEAREIAVKHCGNVADYLGPDLESQMGIYLAEDIAKALQTKQDRIEELEKSIRVHEIYFDSSTGKQWIDSRVNDLELRVKELESALKEAMDYIPDNKLFERAKKAIGGGNG